MGRISRIPSVVQLNFALEIKYCEKSYHLRQAEDDTTSHNISLSEVKTTRQPRVSCLPYPSCLSCYVIFLTGDSPRAGDHRLSVCMTEKVIMAHHITLVTLKAYLGSISTWVGEFLPRGFG